MLKNYNIIFQNGSILTGKMLSLMFDLPKNFAELLYSDRSDGIISGMEFTADEKSIKVSKGVFKYNGCIYLLDHDQSFEIYDDKEREYILFIRENVDKDAFGKECSGDEFKGDIEEKTLDIILTYKSGEVTEDDFILCRFYHSPKMPEDLDDLRRTASYVDLTRYIYSASGKATFIPYVCKLILNKLRYKKDKHPLDYVLMNLILTQGVLSREILTDYIKEAGMNFDDQDSDDGKQLIEVFSKAVNELKFTCNVQQSNGERNSVSEYKKEEGTLTVMT